MYCGLWLQQRHDYNNYIYKAEVKIRAKGTYNRIINIPRFHTNSYKNILRFRQNDLLWPQLNIYNKRDMEYPERIFKRKIYEKRQEWKRAKDGSTALLIN